MQAGTVKTLKVMDHTTYGYMLQNSVFLPDRDEALTLQTGQAIRVFLYPDKQGHMTATTHIPSVQTDSYDWADVTGAIPGLGVFVDIGIPKQVLVSIDELPYMERVWPAEGDMLFVHLTTDKKGRLLAVPASERFFAAHWELASDDLFNQAINGRVYHTSREGTAIISENGYRGFIHYTERTQEPRLGEWVEGRVIGVKDDGSVNVSLLPYKQDRMEDDAEAILAYLERNGGVMHFSDKSDPEDIRGTFHTSKAAFKRAIGKLMKEGKITQNDGKTIRNGK
ncbi:S1-like domain-containing RNA-binding protein [Lentibacillus halophilus]|uniref:S1-like domain-containing RNA-binding protein n=1 Tax=Lentibacillus halophilus TaxID=295065 RepID=A0ABP3JDJ2_9BACI